MHYLSKMQTKYTERLAQFVLISIKIAIVAAICWYFRSVLGYIVLSAVVTLIARPIFRGLKKIRIGKSHLPDWAASLLSLLCVLTAMIGILITVVPVIRGVITDISTANINNIAAQVSEPLKNINYWIIDNFPSAEKNFRIEKVVLTQLQQFLNADTFSSVVGSLTSFLMDFGVTLFAVIFISFFFIQSPHIFSDIFLALLPDKYEKNVHIALHEMERLISRYLVGVTIEILGVSLVSFLGLLLVARMGFRYSIGIAFMTGMLNLIPYVGPLIGGVLGVSLSLTIKYICATSFGLNVGFLPFLIILIGIFTFTQMIDNYLYQPLIYSNSVKVHPLEIFIVFLIAGKIGGMAGMLAAIPGYTVLRVIAKQFMGHIKAVQMLTTEQGQNADTTANGTE